MVKDKIDDKIIGYLRDDARESFVEIGKKLKLSESAVRRRVKNLVDNKVIEVSETHGFWLFGDDTNSAKVLASDLYKNQDNEELSKVWVKDGDTIKKCNITYCWRCFISYNSCQSLIRL